MVFSDRGNVCGVDKPTHVSVVNTATQTSRSAPTIGFPVFILQWSDGRISLFVTPENPPRLEEIRLWLAALDADPAIEVIVSHDLESQARSGLTHWSSRSTK